MKRKIEEKLSFLLAKNPQRVVLLAILLFNILFILISGFVISRLSLSGTEAMGFLEAAFYTVTMILDAGCISFVIEDIGSSGVAVAVFCLIVIIIGMVTFTGAVVGYMTNYISGFIEKANTGVKKLKISDHLVILNWNTRASEVINDLLYCRGRQHVVVLAESGRDEIRMEIEDRLADTVRRYNQELWEKYARFDPVSRYFSYLRGKMTNNVSVVVREGNIYSERQLHDISLERARSVIILSTDSAGKAESPSAAEKAEREYEKGNTHTIKTLMLVSDIVSAEDSADDQKIIVEVTDDWTAALVDRIIGYKQVEGKCKIVPVRVNRILGQLLSQFSLMPELNLAYQELFSNRGASFYAEEYTPDNDLEYISDYLSRHRHAIPLSGISDKKKYFFYSAADRRDIVRTGALERADCKVRLDPDYWIEKKTVVILGHNSKCRDIMLGFAAFRNEWNRPDRGEEILRVIVIDDPESLEKEDYYRQYPFVERTVAASVYDKDRICSTIEEIIDANEEDTSVLILSDDTAASDETDANALVHLVYVQDIINRKKKADPAFDPERIDVVVEIIDPRHHDIVSSYSVYNIVISNRFVSRILAQIGEKEAIFSFFEDILTYDGANAERYTSREIYAKKVSGFFKELPERCSAAEMIRAVWEASTDASIPPERLYPTVMLGYVKPGGRITLFYGDQKDIPVRLEPNDKIIVYSNH